MVHARLHLICGNCGCNDEWEWAFKKDGLDLTDTEVKFADTVHLYCGNCSTLHNIDEYAKERKKKGPLVDCPECETDVHVKHVIEGHISYVICTQCGRRTQASSDLLPLVASLNWNSQKPQMRTHDGASFYLNKIFNAKHYAETGEMKFD